MSYLFKATGLSLRHGGEAKPTETKFEIMPPSSGHCADVAWLPSNIFFVRRTSSEVSHRETCCLQVSEDARNLYLE